MSLHNYFDSVENALLVQVMQSVDVYLVHYSYPVDYANNAAASKIKVLLKIEMKTPVTNFYKGEY